ncbi:MAG TPA: hypothetical protein VLZ89_10370 [Anaerolineales bacterium]|nr:hypothetical protein [Anaerolineales bacterium]
MVTFAQIVEGWHDFYHVIGDASAALMGLLFVSLSLNIPVVTRKANAELRLLAVQTFISYIATLMFAVIFLIPDQGPLGLGLPMLGIDLIVLYVTVARILEMRRNRSYIRGGGGLALRFAAPLLCFAAVLIIAASVLMGRTAGLYWFVPVVIVLFWIASLNAWDLLLQMGRPHGEPPARSRPLGAHRAPDKGKQRPEKEAGL